MHNEVSPALELALEYIGLSNFITDRPSLLNGRLVCRAWRTSRTFSAKISTATLHTLADVQLAAAYLISTPCQRLPWRSVEESFVFPNLRTIYVPEYLSMLLGGCSRSMESMKSIQNVDFHVLNVYAESWMSQEMRAVSELASMGCSVQLAWGGDTDSLLSGANNSALAHVTRLRPGGICFFELRSLSNLRQLPSLRHLVLPMCLLDNDLLPPESCLGVCASLTQLSRLEFSGYGEGVEEELGRMDAMAKFLAPDVVRGLELKRDTEGYDQVHFSNLCASLSQGTFKLVKFDYSFTLRNVAAPDSYFPRQLSEVIKHSPSVHELAIRIGWRTGSPDRFDIKFSTCGSPQNRAGACCVDFETSEAVTCGEMRDGPKHADSRRFWTDPAMHSAQLATVSEQNLQMALRGFDIICPVGINELTHMTEQLPAMFPHLQNLELRLIAAVPQFLSALPHLTTLTHLTFDAYTMLSSPSSNATLSGSVPSIPASLKQLSIRAQCLELLPASELPHLTKLTVSRGPCEETEAVNALYRCNAPVKDLSFRNFPLQDSLPSLANAFPRVDTLDLQLKGFDVSPLSSLQVLRRLRVTLPFPAVMILMGADTLTALASLKVRDANENPEGLTNLRSLTQLRYMSYYVRRPYAQNLNLENLNSENLNLEIEIEKGVRKRWNGIQDDMSIKMPNTRVKVEVLCI